MSGSGYVSVGYFLTRPVMHKRVGQGAARYRTLTPNGHFASVLPSTDLLPPAREEYAGRMELERRKTLDFFSIDRKRGEELRSFMLSPANFGKADWLPECSAIRVAYLQELAQRFLPSGSDACVLGLSVAPSDMDGIVRCFGEGSAPSLPGWIGRRNVPETGGEVVGFDVVPVLRDFPQRGCSWACEVLDWESLEREHSPEFNEWGHLVTHAQASRACRWLRTQEGLCGGDRWFPWRLIAYPLSV